MIEVLVTATLAVCVNTRDKFILEEISFARLAAGLLGEESLAVALVLIPIPVVDVAIDVIVETASLLTTLHQQA